MILYFVTAEKEPQGGLYILLQLKKIENDFNLFKAAIIVYSRLIMYFVTTGKDREQLQGCYDIIFY